MLPSPSLLPPQMPGEASAVLKNHTSSPDATAQLLQMDDRLSLNITFAGLCTWYWQRPAFRHFRYIWNASGNACYFIIIWHTHGVKQLPLPKAPVLLLLTLWSATPFLYWEIFMLIQELFLLRLSIRCISGFFPADSWRGWTDCGSSPRKCSPSII